MTEALHKGSQGTGAKDLIKALVQVREEGEQGEDQGEGQVREKGGGGIGDLVFVLRGICVLISHLA